MRRQDFSYQLPDELIARHPTDQRASSRLLYVPREGPVQDRRFRDFPVLLDAADLLVFNNSRVIPARAFGRKASGGRVELLLERAIDNSRAWVKLRASKTPVNGTAIVLDSGHTVKVTGRRDDLFCVEFGQDPVSWFEAHGQVPLPPYVDRPPEPRDSARYQTIYARHPGSVAAPTAGLHFDDTMFAHFSDAGVECGFVTLHVGSGTYQPVRCDDLSAHRMHAERVTVSAELVSRIRHARQRGGRIIAVGTTSLRSLEAASASGRLEAFDGDTEIFIYPGYAFKTVDALLTNFHLPESTLLMLVSAFAGHERIMSAYQHAIDERYRFFSYGDCMFLERNTGDTSTPL